MSARILALALSWFVVAACGAPAAAPTAPGPPAPPSPPPPPVASAPGTASAAPTAKSGAPAAAPVTLEAIPLHLAADGFAGPVSFHPMDGATLVTAHGFAGVIEGDGLVPHPEWMKAPGNPFEHDGIVAGGRYPDSAWLAVTKDESLVKWTVELWRLRAGKWVKARGDEKNGPVFLDILALANGTVVAVRTDPYADEVLFSALDGPPLKLFGGGRGDPRDERRSGCARGCGWSNLARGRATATTDSIYLLGRYKWEAEREVHVEGMRLDGRGSLGLSAGPWNRDTVRVDAVGIVATGGSSYAVAAIGEQKSAPPIASLRRMPVPPTGREPTPPPPPGRLSSLAGASDGTICVTTEPSGASAPAANAFCSPRGRDELMTLLLPPEEAARRVWVRRIDDVWVATGARPGGSSPPRYALYRSAGSAPTLHVGASGAAVAERAPFLPPPDGFWKCEHPFVVALSGAGVPDATRTRVAAALAVRAKEASAEVVEGVERGRPYLGAVVRDWDAGQGLARALAKIPGATPRFVCFDPASTHEPR